MLTREEILAVYAAGPEAVVSVIEQLQRELLALSGRVQVLEDRLRKDSHNSHKPPSSDGLTRGAPKSLRGKSGKAPRAQPGHPGQMLRPVEEADEFRLHAVPACAHCGTSLEAVAPCATERRQVFDLPKLAFHVTEHQAQTKCCPCCGQSTKAAFPAGVSQAAQYGAGVLALSVYLQTCQLLPYARSAQLMRDLFGRAPSQGTLAARYDALLSQGRSANPLPPSTGTRGRPKHTRAQNLLERLDRHRRAVLAFVHDFSVPFDNNLAERDLRMAKVQQKISGGFRSAQGAAFFCRIRGYISTLRKQKSHVLFALNSLFAGTPLLPQLQG